MEEDNSVAIVHEDLELIEGLVKTALPGGDVRAVVTRKFGRIRNYIKMLEKFYQENEKGKPLDKFLKW